MAIVFLRTILIFCVVVLSMRLMGKRQLGELELSELVVSVLIADIAANPLQDIGTPLLNGLIPVVTLLCCEMLVSFFIVRSVRFRALLCGKPSMLIVRGVVDQREMRRNRFTLDELTEELRKQGVTDIASIEYAILETDGRLNTILFPAHQPVTAAQMGLDTPAGGYPTILINDGRVLSENLRRQGLDEKWLRAELRRRGVKSAREVYLLMRDDAGAVYFEPMERGRR